MIHYHVGPIWPQSAATAVWGRRHGLTSFGRPEQVSLMADQCQSFIIDCSSFSHWVSGEGEVDVPGYAEFVHEWDTHPGYDWCLIPDIIDGSEFDNDRMISRWMNTYGSLRNSVPVWHLHESLDRLRYLARCYQSGVYPLVALGSSGQWSTPGSRAWWHRMNEVMAVVTDEQGRPTVRLHGLRMLSSEIITRLPLRSADSSNAARNIGIDKKWEGPYKPVTESMRAQVLAERIESVSPATHWRPIKVAEQSSLLDLFGDAA